MPPPPLTPTPLCFAPPLTPTPLCLALCSWQAWWARKESPLEPMELNMGTWSIDDTTVCLDSRLAPTFSNWLAGTAAAADSQSPQRLDLVFSYRGLATVWDDLMRTPVAGTGTDGRAGKHQIRTLQTLLADVAAACGRTMHTLSIHVEPNIPFSLRWVMGFAGLDMLWLRVSCERITLG